jgi:menaquinone-dependent protoporphyrinogen oxidase
VRILVTYATKNGSTAGVAETIADELRATGHEPDLTALGHRVDLATYDGVVLGAPLYSGRWLSPARRFLKRNRETLSRMPVALFALGPRADSPEAWQRSRDQLEHTLSNFAWLQPRAVELFGGADPPGKGSGRDIRDWATIRAWADGLPEALESDRES